METAVYILAVGVIGLLLTIGGFVWKLSGRISTSEAAAATALQRADNAGDKVDANANKIEKVASELASHREVVAREYVSYSHMVTLENRLVDAISQLGNRIDALFSRSMPAQH